MFLPLPPSLFCDIFWAQNWHRGAGQMNYLFTWLSAAPETTEEEEVKMRARSASQMANEYNKLFRVIYLPSTENK